MRVLFATVAIGLMVAGNPLLAAGADMADGEAVVFVTVCVPSDKTGGDCRRVQQPTAVTIALADERHAKRKRLTQMPWMIGAFQ